MPVFFVISGYCISATIEVARRRPRPLGTYFGRRFRRIYPPYWCLLFIAVTIMPLFNWLTGRSISEIPTDCKPSTLTLSQWFGNLTSRNLAIPLVWRSSERALFGHAWTLCQEEQFYFVAGILLLLMPRKFFAGVRQSHCSCWDYTSAPVGRPAKRPCGFVSRRLVAYVRCRNPGLFHGQSMYQQDAAWAAYAVFAAGIAVTAYSFWRRWPESRDFNLFVAWLCLGNLAFTPLGPANRFDKSPLAGYLVRADVLQSVPRALSRSSSCKPLSLRRWSQGCPVHCFDHRSDMHSRIDRVRCATLFAVERFFLNSRIARSGDTHSPGKRVCRAPGVPVKNRCGLALM